jgi:hypothetical protein
MIIEIVFAFNYLGRCKLHMAVSDGTELPSVAVGVPVGWDSPDSLIGKRRDLHRTLCSLAKTSLLYQNITIIEYLDWTPLAKSR